MFYSVTTLTKFWNILRERGRIGGNYWATPFVLTGKFLQFFLMAVALFHLPSLNLFLPAGSLSIRCQHDPTAIID